MKQIMIQIVVLACRLAVYYPLNISFLQVIYTAPIQSQRAFTLYSSFSISRRRSSDSLFFWVALKVSSNSCN